MKKYGKGLLLCSVMFISLIVLPGITLAQPDGGPEFPDPDAPIDGGIGLLVATGIGYGVKKVRDNRKKKTTHLL